MADPAKKEEEFFNNEPTTESDIAKKFGQLKLFRPLPKTKPFRTNYFGRPPDVTHEESDSNWLISYADMMTLLVGFFILLLSFSKMDAAKFEQVKRSTTKIFGGEYKVPYEKLEKRLKQVVDKEHLNNEVVYTQNDEGLAVSFRGALFFDSGSYDLKGDALALMLQIVPVLSQSAHGLNISVEGHTDDRPSVGKFTNWELSSLRACAVLKIFEAHGFSHDKLKAQGFGDTHPVVPNEDEKGNPLPENQAQNRRVVIKITKSFEEQ